MIAQLDRERAEFLALFNSGIAEVKTNLGGSCDTIAGQVVGGGAGKTTP